jgi:hypothetical protein
MMLYKAHKLSRPRSEPVTTYPRRLPALYSLTTQSTSTSYTMDTVKSIIDTVSQAASSTFESSYDVARKGFGEGTNEHVSIRKSAEHKSGRLI